MSCLVYSAHDVPDQWEFYHKSRPRALKEAQEQANHSGNLVEVYLNVMERPSLDLMIRALNHGTQILTLKRGLLATVHPVNPLTIARKDWLAAVG